MSRCLLVHNKPNLLCKRKQFGKSQHNNNIYTLQRMHGSIAQYLLQSDDDVIRLPHNQMTHIQLKDQQKGHRQKLAI